MRKLPKLKSDKQKLIIACCQDYFGKGQNTTRSNQIALWIMGKRARVSLLEEEKQDMSNIQDNLKDPIYTESMLL